LSGALRSVGRPPQGAVGRAMGSATKKLAAHPHS
jgi:hypothetical protein